MDREQTRHTEDSWTAYEDVDTTGGEAMGMENLC